MGSYPSLRLRRMRTRSRTREAVRETVVPPSSLILPVFVDPTVETKVPIRSMPGQYRWSPRALEPLSRRAEDAGLAGLLLFGRPKKKDAKGSEAWAKGGAVQVALRSLRASTDLLLVSDVCLCAYTDSGHCGYWKAGQLQNDPSLEALGRIAVSQAEAGADWVAPSAMLDGQVRALRRALDARGASDTAILAYAAKFASSFYGPFREAEGSTPLRGDRKGYQMDPSNAREALHEMELDAEEGADVLMVKPALPCLDILARARRRFHHPLAGYHVSGEYAMLKAAVANRWLDEPDAVRESLTAIRRAGADLVISYYALEAVESGWL